MKALFYLILALAFTPLSSPIAAEPRIKITSHPYSAQNERGEWKVEVEKFGESTGAPGAAAEFKFVPDPAHKGILHIWLYDPRSENREEFRHNGSSLTVRLVPVEDGKDERINKEGPVQTMKISRAEFGRGSRLHFKFNGKYPGTNRVSARHEGATDDNYRATVSGHGETKIVVGVHVVHE